ncbi:MAG: DUF1028 domain-containing protein [Ignavibacteriae bacterium]|nr:DUF1028 domain-containing protein [Ignavibacteriota bacterium]
MKNKISLSVFYILIFIFYINVNAQDTFSIVAIDPVTGQVGSAGASCHPDCTILTDVHPGWGVVHTQAAWLQANYDYAKSLMNLHLSPQQILDSMIAHDAQNNPTTRQYGIIDLINGGRTAAYTGVNCSNWKGHIIGPTYTIQGNILLGSQIIDSRQARFNRMQGTLAQKLMAALQGAKVIGADTRCAPNTSSQSAFIRVANVGDTIGPMYLNLKVTNAVKPPFGKDPIDSLQVLFNGWLTGVYGYSEVIPDKIILFQNYPNPFNPSTNFKFSLNTNTFVTLKVYNLLGEEIAAIINSDLKAGTYDMKWEPNGLASGIYYYRLNTETFTDTKRMVLIK